MFSSLYPYASLLEEQYAKGWQERADTNPKRYRLHAILIDGGLSGTHLIGLYIHHVILFEVIYRGIEYILGTNIHPMGDTLAFFFTNHEDSIPFAVDGQITCHADGFQQADLVFGDGILAGVFTSPSTEK